MNLHSKLPQWSNPEKQNKPLVYPPEDQHQQQYSQKVFIGGLPIDATEADIRSKFEQYGKLCVEWPKPQTLGASSSKRFFGFVFVVYHSHASVEQLISRCHHDEGKYYTLLSTSTFRQKPVQIRPWRLKDARFFPPTISTSVSLNPRFTCFVGGLPRPTTAHEIFRTMEREFGLGSVCYVEIDLDPEFNYPKGVARITFLTYTAYIRAMRARFITMANDDSRKVEIKPYFVEDQQCDNCNGKLCFGQPASSFCSDIACLQYYCSTCWDRIHLDCGNNMLLMKRRNHKPFARFAHKNTSQ